MVALGACLCSAALWHTLYSVLLHAIPSKRHAAPWSMRLVSTVFATVVTQRSLRFVTRGSSSRRVFGKGMEELGQMLPSLGSGYPQYV